MSLERHLQFRWGQCSESILNGWMKAHWSSEGELGGIWHQQCHVSETEFKSVLPKRNAHVLIWDLFPCLLDTNFALFINFPPHCHHHLYVFATFYSVSFCMFNSIISSCSARDCILFIFIFKKLNYLSGEIYSFKYGFWHLQIFLYFIVRVVTEASLSAISLHNQKWSLLCVVLCSIRRVLSQYSHSWSSSLRTQNLKKSKWISC